MPAVDEAEACRVARQFRVGIGEQIVRAVRIPSGFSGAEVYRCDASGSSVQRQRAWALKRYPVGTTRERVTIIHQWMTAVHQHGCELVPLLAQTGPDRATWVETKSSGPPLSEENKETYFWELSQWMPGAPIDVRHEGKTDAIAFPRSAIEADRCSHADNSPNHDSRRHQAVPHSSMDFLLSQIRAGAKAIGQVHSCSRNEGQDQAIAPAVKERHLRLTQLPNRLAAMHRADLRRATFGDEHQFSDQILRPSMDVLTRAISVHLSAMLQRMQSWKEQRTTRHWVLRDVHDGHVLFESNRGTSQVSSIIDFDAIRFDTPSADVSRWATSFLGIPFPGGTASSDAHGPNFTSRPAIQGIGEPGSQNWENRVWESVLAGYRMACPLSKSQEMLARDLAFVSPLISLANWCDWLILQRRTFSAGIETVSQRMEKLFRQCSVAYRAGEH
ncbi:MAG: phosphotransferase [Planctomycetota bacterium]